MKMPTKVASAMPDIVDQQIFYRAVGVPTLPNKASDRITDSHELSACRRRIVKQIQHHIGLEA
jgi:hypothetical protein